MPNTKRMAVSANIPTGSVVMSNKTESIGAGGQFTIPTTNNTNYDVQSTGGAVTSSTTPFGIVAPADNTELTITGLSDANPVTIPFADIPYGCLIDGDFIAKRGTTCRLKWNAALLRYTQQGFSQLI